MHSMMENCGTRLEIDLKVSFNKFNRRSYTCLYLVSLANGREHKTGGQQPLSNIGKLSNIRSD